MYQDLLFKSFTIRERINYLNRILKTTQEDFSPTLNYWIKNVGESSNSYFERRLKNSNLDKKDLQNYISEIIDFDLKNFDYPVWYQELQKFSKSNKKLLKKDIKNIEIPFIEINQQILDYVMEEFSFPKNTFQNDFKKSLKLQLLSDLSQITSQSLLEFYYSKNKSYDDFLKIFDFDEFFTSYPYLTRLVFTKLIFYKTNTKFLLDSAKRDFSKISKEFNFRDGEKFSSIKFSGSDTHNYGKSVLILSTSKENQVVFKYREGKIDIKFNKILRKIIKNIILILLIQNYRLSVERLIIGLPFFKIYHVIMKMKFLNIIKKLE